MSTADTFLSRFINNPAAYALQRNDGSYKCLRNASITTDLLIDHLVGEITLGVYSTNPENNTSLWICWDIDDDQERELNQLMGWLNFFNICPIRESRRQGRSGHVWIFFEQPIPTADAYRLLRFGRDMAQIKGEIFPAQPELKGGIGNLVRLPLGRHRKPSANGVWGLFEACSSPLPEDQLAWFLDQPLTGISTLDNILETVPRIEPPKPKKPYNGPTTPLIDEFPTTWQWLPQPSGEWLGQCPVCLSEQHDAQQNNLSLNPVENVLFCHFNQGQHSFQQILQSARNLKKTVTI